MLKIKFLKSKVFVEAGFELASNNIVKLTGDIPENTNGFDVYTLDEILLGKYEDFTTIYRKGSDYIEFSNDDSVWLPTITFSSNGGTLEGLLVQNASDYSQIAVPAPVDDENWQFKNWDKEIPTSGSIEEDETFTAEFEFIGAVPEPSEPSTDSAATTTYISLEERVAELEATQEIQDEAIVELSEILGGEE